MNPAGADVAITDTMPPTLVTQLAPDRATAGSGDDNSRAGRPQCPLWRQWRAGSTPSCDLGVPAYYTASPRPCCLGELAAP